MTASGSGKGFVSSARLISGLTLVSRILGLVRHVLCVSYFGTALWDHFVIPFQVPNLFRRLFGEGALSAALIPVYTEQLQRDEQTAKALARTVVSLLIILLGLVTLLGWVLLYLYWQISRGGFETQLRLQLAAIMLPYMILICAVGAIGGLLNVHRHFAAPAAAPILLNVCMIAAVLYFVRFFGDEPGDQLYGVAVAVLVAGCGQLLGQVPSLRRAGISLWPRINFADPGLKRIFKLMAPMMLGLSVMQINVLMDNGIATLFRPDSVSGTHFSFAGRMIAYPIEIGGVTALSCAQLLYQFPLGVFGIALATAIFPHLSAAAAKKDFAELGQTLNQGLRLAVFIAVPAALGLIVLRVPLAGMFERGQFTPADTQRVAGTLLFYALGIGAYCVQHIVVRAYYSLQDSVTPVKVAVRMVALNLGLNLILIWPLGTGGLALSTAFCATIQVTILLRRLSRTYSLNVSVGLIAVVIKTTIAAFVMGVVGYLLLGQVSSLSVWLQLAVVVPACAGVFALTSLALRTKEMKLLMVRK